MNNGPFLTGTNRGKGTLQVDDATSQAYGVDYIVFSGATLTNDGNGKITITVAGGGGGISFNGSTANGVVTYGNATTADVESQLTYSGTTLSNTGSIAANKLSASLSITAGVGLIATTGGVTATAGDIVATAGDITATAGDIVATAGDITATAGDITATAGDIIATAGDITATAGSMTAGTVGAGTTVTAGTTVLANAVSYGRQLISPHIQAIDMAPLLGNLDFDSIGLPSVGLGDVNDFSHIFLNGAGKMLVITNMGRGEMTDGAIYVVTAGTPNVVVEFDNGVSATAPANLAIPSVNLVNVGDAMTFTVVAGLPYLL